MLKAEAHSPSVETTMSAIAGAITIPDGFCGEEGYGLFCWGEVYGLLMSEVISVKGK